MQVGVIGCSGRTGSRIVTCLEQNSKYKVGPGFSRKSSFSLSHIVQSNDVLVDFSTPHVTEELIDQLQYFPKPVIIGTSAFPGNFDRRREKLQTLVCKVPVVLCPNVSMGAYVQKRLVTLLAQLCNECYDIRITETHHRNKQDRISGTAQDLVTTVCRTKLDCWGQEYSLGSFGKTGRKIELHSSRVGDVPGEHEVAFVSNGEQIIVRHTVFSREVFALGVLHILDWLFTVNPEPSLYGFEDALKVALWDEHCLLKK
ncbi:4-hydroxy-tetrahydrodipicolinate reductase [Candidatus Chlamydia sanziniae]|uniref:4-hydroxy-tetrahydrodipicolinate reductase n=1 Tax=Candidatus Chlamydia sanziniae TaxID=1806891 RepID=A0A1A9HV21_9CHLA|nr:dihydrodipicolinate reductase C-terminal domain-containing protein [Candidatus Chlamydia sanziniae]ANH78839.1 4-hydroxy-tetrahydrodipicolinate reductase [Candidatus Chlamydia sanziniae]